MSAHLVERLKTALQEPRSRACSLQEERLLELSSLRREVTQLRIENMRWQVVVEGYRELLREAEPSTVAKGEA